MSDDDFKKYFNDEKKAIEFMTPQELQRHFNELNWIVFEAKARIMAVTDEVSEREKAIKNFCDSEDAKRSHN